jgi:transcriptional regulator with XRE-family HTH domain
MGVTQKQIADYKSGVIPDAEKLDKFCNEYRVPPEELFIDPMRLAALREGMGALESDLLETVKRFIETAGYEVRKRH